MQALVLTRLGRLSERAGVAADGCLRRQLLPEPGRRVCRRLSAGRATVLRVCRGALIK